MSLYEHIDTFAKTIVRLYWAGHGRSKKLLFQFIILFLTEGIVKTCSYCSSILLHLRILVLRVPWVHIIVIRLSICSHVWALLLLSSIKILICFWIVSPNWLLLHERGLLRELLGILHGILISEITEWSIFYSSILDLNGFLGFSWGIGGNFSIDFCFYESAGAVWSSRKLDGMSVTGYQTHALWSKIIVWIVHVWLIVGRTLLANIFEVRELPFELL